MTLLNVSSCSKLIPDAWRQPVAGADLPPDDSAGSWIKFGDAQTGKLDTANDHSLSGLGIIERCEERDKAVQIKIEKKWYEFWK